MASRLTLPDAGSTPAASTISVALGRSGSGSATGGRLGVTASTERLIPRSLPLPRREIPPFGRLLAPRTTISSGQDRKPADSTRAVELEVSPVDREDARDLFPLGDPNKPCVGEVHRKVPVLPHQLAHARYVGRLQRQDLYRVAFQDSPEPVLGFRGKTEQVHRFRYRRPDGPQRLPDLLERFPAGNVMTVVGVDERDQGSCVDQDQERFLPRSSRS